MRLQDFIIHAGLFATLPEKYKETLNGVKDMIFNSYLRKEDLETERKIITQEAWNRFQNEKYLNYIKELNKNIYRGSIRERFFSSLGWPETISKISQKDVKDFIILIMEGKIYL